VTESYDAAVRALAAEHNIRGLLGSACREAVGLLDATACAISRVIGDLLVGLDEHTRSGRPLAHGHEYLISDFPLTRAVVERGKPRWVSRLDEDADPQESALLEKLGFESLLMVGLPAAGGCWGLVEIYNERGAFDEGQAQLADRFARETGVLLDRLETAGRG
jgi:hypothetical protein